MEEVWRAIPNYEGIYEANNLGQIRTCKGKTTYTALHGIRRLKQRYLKYKTEKSKGSRQDFRVTLWKDGKPKDYLVSRLICAAFHGEPENSKMTVDHLNGDYQDNRPENLEWVTRKENVDRGWAKGAYNTRKLVVITNKVTGFKKFVLGLECASRLLGKKHGYLNYIITKKNGETAKYKIAAYEW